MKADEPAIKELENSPKAHQLLNHLSTIGIKDAEVRIQTNLARQWLSLSLYWSLKPPFEDIKSCMAQTNINFVDGQMAFVSQTWIHSDVQGKGLYSLIADLRDRMVEKLEVKFQSSMIRNDNENRQKAALKHGWKKSFVGTNHCVFVKEVRSEN